jgi:hypothetical protein
VVEVDAGLKRRGGCSRSRRLATSRVCFQTWPPSSIRASSGGGERQADENAQRTRRARTTRCCTGQAGTQVATTTGPRRSKPSPARTGQRHRTPTLIPAKRRNVVRPAGQRDPAQRLRRETSKRRPTPARLSRFRQITTRWRARTRAAWRMRTPRPKPLGRVSAQTRIPAPPSGDRPGT